MIPAELESFVPSLFDAASGCRVSDLRLTTEDLRDAAVRLGRSINHGSLVGVVERVCAGENLTPWTYTTVVGFGEATQDAKGYILDGFQALRVLGSFTGEPGRVMLKKWADYTQALEVRNQALTAKSIELERHLALEQAGNRVAAAFYREYHWLADAMEGIEGVVHALELVERTSGLHTLPPVLRHRTDRLNYLASRVKELVCRLPDKRNVQSATEWLLGAAKQATAQQP